MPTDDLMPLEQRRHLGNPSIVSFCRVCEENTIPRNGVCLWCLVEIGRLRPTPEEQLELIP